MKSTFIKLQNESLPKDIGQELVIVNTRGGGTPIDWDTGCANYLRVLFQQENKFLVYFIACNKFLGQDFSLE